MFCALIDILVGISTSARRKNSLLNVVEAIRSLHIEHYSRYLSYDLTGRDTGWHISMRIILQLIQGR